MSGAGQAGEPPAAGAGFGRLLGVLVAPGKTFAAIAARPTWVAPLVALVLLVAIDSYLIGGRLDWERSVRHRLAASGRELSAEQIEQSIAMFKRIGPALTLGSAVTLAPGGYLLAALLFWVGSRLLGSEIGYRTSLSTTLHGLMPGAIAALLAIPVILRRSSLTDEEARGGLLLSNLAFLAPPEAGPGLRSLLTSLDLFSLWAVVLLVIGYRTTARLSRAGAAGLVVTLWLVYVAGRAALAAVLPS